MNRATPTHAQLVADIDQCLPQTQCTLCTYPRCRAYAEAIATRRAQINQCPPGGAETIAQLARLLEQPILPLNPQYGTTEPTVVAYIREAECIGCLLCRRACPVDCIVGAAKLMHTVLRAQCTGCKLCVPACPTDCIELVAAPPLASSAARADGPANEPDATLRDAPSPWPPFTRAQVARARVNTERKQARLQGSLPARRMPPKHELQQQIAAAHRRHRA